MTDLPPEIAADDGDRAEAAALIARIGGARSVVEALALDLADGLGRRPIAITASDELGWLAATHWTQVLTSVGVEVVESGDGAETARLHLHGDPSTVARYSPGGREGIGGGDDDMAAILHGEVIAQGTSAAARYLSLTAVADALADHLAT